MSWRTVVVASSAKLDYQLGYLVVRKEDVTKIHINEIAMVIIESTAVSLTAALLSEMMKRKIKVIFCDEKRNPSSELIPYYGSHDTSITMAVKVYNKLVRDKIPEIIEADGRKCKTEILSEEAYLKMVDAKLDEELAEYHKDQNIEELADLLEVIYAAAQARGYSVEELERVRVAKVEKRGAFQKRILLKETE